MALSDTTLLVKCITLLYKESIIKEDNSSKDMVKVLLDSIKIQEIGFGLSGDREVISNLKNVCLEMVNSTDSEYCKEDLLQTLKISSLHNDKLYKTIEDGINATDDEKILKRNVVSIRRSINNHLREIKIGEILNRASYAFKFQRNEIKDASQFISELVAQLEPLQTDIGTVDNAIMDDIDIGDDDSLTRILTKVRNRSAGTNVYKTGWSELNDMLQGGFRPGECVIIPALQHKYKTGFSLSLFAQLAMHNSPMTKDISKKPLLLRISFEDDIDSNVQFLYQYLKYNETKVPVKTNDVGVQEMSMYIREKLQHNGFSVKMIRVDPTQWTYKNLCSKVTEYESMGYNVEVLMVDYLAMLPTVGCINTGPMGTDLRDLFRRLRNYCSSKDILFMTPHQLSTDAKNLIRNGVPNSEFVKEIAEKGFFAGSKQLDQEVDIELYLHLFAHNKETYISVQRGKHRLPSIVPEEQKYFLLKFPPKGMPITETIDDSNHVPLRKLPNRTSSNVTDDLYRL